MLLIKGADVYAPEHLGKMDVLAAGGRIERIGERLPEYEGCEVIDGTGKLVTPGIIDRHVHITGGGGEGSFHTQAPPVQLSKLIEGGVTTVVGVLGTDGISRSVENLVAKAKALKEEGISVFCTCGAYGYPSPTITGTIDKDILFVDEIIGLKLAVSDHRAPNITVDELIRLGSDVRTAGMLSGKAGIICLHMGGDKRGLEPIFEALERTSIPIKTFQPTHVGRSEKLQSDAFKFAKMGGTIDITCGQFERKIQSVAASLRAALAEGVPMDKVTLSSDGQGSWSNYDAAGNLTEMGVSEVNTIYRQIVHEVKEEKLPFEQAILFGTSNVAKALELYPKKGAVREGSDADLLVWNEELSLEAVIANGTVMMKDGVLKKRGTYESTEK
ncbi:MAG: beta-aspartyl-peptidase [Lachnospiraceae bacterium]|nr:beta-aspartyl-peptidase [Lachnospiraceae bacterium]